MTKDDISRRIRRKPTNKIWSEARRVVSGYKFNDDLFNRDYIILRHMTHTQDDEVFMKNMEVIIDKLELIVTKHYPIPVNAIVRYVRSISDDQMKLNSLKEYFVQYIALRVSEVSLYNAKRLLDIIKLFRGNRPVPMISSYRTLKYGLYDLIHYSIKIGVKIRLTNPHDHFTTMNRTRLTLYYHMRHDKDIGVDFYKSFNKVKRMIYRNPNRVDESVVTRTAILDVMYNIESNNQKKVDEIIFYLMDAGLTNLANNLISFFDIKTYKALESL